MRVLLVRGPSTGGIGVHVRALAAGLRDLGHDVVVYPTAGWKSMMRIRSWAAGVDVVHAHGVRAGALAGLAVGITGAGRRPRPRLVVTLHNAPIRADRIRGRIHDLSSTVLERFISQRADVVLGVSPDLVSRIVRFGAHDSRFAPVAAPCRDPLRTRAEVRAELGLDDDRRLVLAVGRLAPQKDYPTLLKAFEGHPAGLDGVLVAIAGDGPLRPALQERIDAHGLPFCLLGHRDDVPDLLEAADVFVICSTWEARPLALQEAMRAGVPSVATAVGGVPELVGAAALLVPSGDPRALAQAIEKALAAAPELSVAARKRAEVWPGARAELAAVISAYALPVRP